MQTYRHLFLRLGVCCRPSAAARRYWFQGLSQLAQVF